MVDKLQQSLQFYTEMSKKEQAQTEISKKESTKEETEEKKVTLPQVVYRLYQYMYCAECKRFNMKL